MVNANIEIANVLEHLTSMNVDWDVNFSFGEDLAATCHSHLGQAKKSPVCVAQVQDQVACENKRETLHALDGSGLSEHSNPWMHVGKRSVNRKF